MPGFSYGVLPDGRTFVVRGAGHSATCGSRVDLAAVMRATFPELLDATSSTGTETDSRRTAMQPEATKDAGTKFGLIPRPYPSLDPATYWDASYFFPPS